MTAYIIKETIPCWVTMKYRVEAQNHAQAIEAFYESQADYIGEEVGDTIGWLDHTALEIEEA